MSFETLGKMERLACQVAVDMIACNVFLRMKEERGSP